jgi:hypothetical protein
MKTKHTPGPWSTEVTEDSIFVVPQVNDHDYVALIDKRWDTSIEGTHEANAHLIAAAPEMLETLEAIYKELDEPSWRLINSNRSGDQSLGNTLSWARALCEKAIAKARGGS